LTFWQALIIEVVLCGTILVIVLKGVSFAFGKFRINAQNKVNKAKDQNDKDDLEKTTLNTHIKTTMLIDAKITETITNICQIKNHDILKEQMNYAENKYVQVWGVLSRIFVSLLSDRLKNQCVEGTDLLNHVDMKKYQECFIEMYKEIFDYIRASFKDNHYAELSEEDFSRYAEEKTEVITQMVTDRLNQSYHGTCISRAETYKANKEKDSDIKNMIYDVFLKARKISQDKLKEIERLQKEKNEFIYNVIGVQL
jgi:DNA integrity scanning protein DisA with diadenylate cyclase activity